MANLTSVSYVSGSLSNTVSGTVSTLDNLVTAGGVASTNVLTVQGTASGVAQPVTGTLTGVTTVSAVTAITNALPAGTNVIGHVIVDTAPSTAVTNAGTFATQSKVTDGTNTAAVKAASVAPLATDPALVVAISPNSVSAPRTTSGAMSAGFALVGLPTDQLKPNLLQTQSSGATASRVVAGATTNATSLKASAGNIANIDVFNVAAYTVFLKLYDTASAPTVGTDTPVWTIPIAAGAGYSRHFHNGRHFGTGIAYAITKLQADSDTTAVAAGDVTGSVEWI